MSKRTVLAGVLGLVVLTLVGVVLGAAVRAATAKPDFGLGTNPTGMSVPQGEPATYTITASTVDGFSGTVGLAATGLPSGVTAEFSTTSLVLSRTAPSSSATLTVRTALTTAPGTYSVTVVATSGKLSHTLSLGLTVNRLVSPSIALAVAPASATVPAGSAAVFTVTIARTGVTGPVGITVPGPLPTGTTALVSPASTTGNSVSVQLSTSAASPDGSFPVDIVGTAGSGTATQRATARATLVISTPPAKNFTLAGDLTTALAPGIAPQPLNLTVQNPNSQPIAISTITITVRSTSAGAACGPDNFTAVQYSGPYPLTVPARQSSTLAELGVPAAQWPKVGMLDLPRNQDACRGVRLTLDYAGAGRGA